MTAKPSASLEQILAAFHRMGEAVRRRSKETGTPVLTRQTDHIEPIKQTANDATVDQRGENSNKSNRQ